MFKITLYKTINSAFPSKIWQVESLDMSEVVRIDSEILKLSDLITKSDIVYVLEKGNYITIEELDEEIYEES